MIPQTTRVRVAMVVEAGKIKPVWFEQTDKPSRERIFITYYSRVLDHEAGTFIIKRFNVSDGNNTWQLSLNTQDFTWQLSLSAMAE